VSDSPPRGGEVNPTEPAVAAIIARKARSLVGRAGLRHQDRDDLVQELTLQVLARRDQYEPSRGTWPGFVKRLVERLGNNLVRDRLAAKRYGGPHRPLGEPIPAPHDPRADSRALDVAEALGTLPPDLRVVAELLMTRAVTEVAEVLGVARSTVYARLREIRERPGFSALGGNS
jgi:RNA polymerase sigma factor (sigma-70 family)